MAGITLTQAQTQLDTYLAAETAVLGGQRYTIGDRELHRANLAEIQAGIELWNNRVITLTNQQSGRSRSRTVVVGF
jgi:Family of unknown function (DUF6148)